MLKFICKTPYFPLLIWIAFSDHSVHFVIWNNNETYYHTHIALFQLNLAQFSLYEMYFLPSCTLHACDQKKLMLKFSCPTCNCSFWISVLFPWHVLNIVIYVSVRGDSVAVNEILIHKGTHLSNRWICATEMARNPWFTGFIPTKT